jgi:hypothetical protein
MADTKIVGDAEVVVTASTVIGGVMNVAADGAVMGRASVGSEVTGVKIGAEVTQPPGVETGAEVMVVEETGAAEVTPERAEVA